MNKKTHKRKYNAARYFTMFRGIKLPWFLILFSFASSAAMMSAELQTATLTADIIDTSQSAIDSKVLITYISVAAISAVLNIVSNYFTRKMEEVITLRFRVKLFSKILRLPTRYYDTDNGDELVSRVTSDASAPSTLFTIAVSFVVCVVTTVQGFTRLFEYNKTLASYSLLIIPMTFLLCLIYGKLMFKLGVYGTVTMAGSLGYLAERVRNFRLIKSVAAERIEAAKGEKSFFQMYKADFLSWLMVAGYQLASGMFSVMFIVIVFVFGGRLIPSGKLTIGDLTSFYMITSVVSMQLMQFFMDVGSVSSTLGSMKKISEVIDTDCEKSEGNPVPLICSELSFDHVSFAYHEEREILHDLSFKIPGGKVTAIIGGNGAGKSTVFKLLTRLYEPNEGKILFGNDDIGSYDVSQWRDRFTYVFQKNPLIGGTVRENMTYGLDREVSDEELIQAAKKANCYDFICEKPNGFDEDVGLGGSNFSGGQAQCISIARAMLRNSDYLLLDEATSNLDVLSESLVTEALSRLMENKTTIMIAHNYAATKNADYVIVMKEGTVEDSGTPEQLLQTNEYYRLFCKTL